MASCAVSYTHLDVYKRQIVGRSEFTADGGYIEVFSVGSRNFKWIIQALEACNASSFDFIFTVERTERGILNLTGMSLGNGGRL